MIHPKHLKELIIEPTLKYLEMHSESAVNLLLGTAAVESHLGRYLMQIDHNENPVGPALGIFQMEPATHRDIWDTYLFRQDKLELKRFLREKFPLCGPENPELLITDLKYATVMARLKYWRDREALPQAGDIEGLAHYWKRIFNTAGGKGTVEEFISNYERFITTG